MKHLLSLLLIISLVSCNNKDIKGVVVDKTYRASYSYYTIMPIHNESTTTFYPMARTEPERYTLVVKDSVARNVNTTRHIYDAVCIGDSLFITNKIVTYKHK